MGFRLDASAGRVAKLKVCLVGDEGVGKTSLIRRFVYSMYDEAYIRTVGTMVSKRTIDIDEIGFEANIMVWDIMGRKDFMELFKEAYFNHARGIIAVFDLTRTATLRSLEEWIGGIKSTVGNVPTMILANKADIRPSGGLSNQDIDKFCAEHATQWLPTSARTGENVESAFRDLAIRIIKSP